MSTDLNVVTGQIVDAALKIHEALGPGLLESVYQSVLERELDRRGLHVAAQCNVPFQFEGMHFQQGLTVDLLVERAVLVELKSVEKLAPVHFKQVLTYLRLLDYRIGLLINFGGARLKDGLHRIANNYQDKNETAAAALENSELPE
jgi:iron complex transport system substrate-binding protein